MQRTHRGFVSLRLLLMVFTGSLILLLLVVSLVAGLAAFRDYMTQQLEDYAKGGAVATGLSLSHAIDGRDPVASSSLIDSVFDSGNYFLIRYSNHAQDFVIEREDDSRELGAPAWFIRLANLDSGRFTKSASVMRGWQFLGTVEVTSHPRQGYRDLWRMTRRLALGSLVIGGTALLILYLTLRRTLRPLASLEAQAQAIRRRDFRFRATAAGTRELARVTSAMNQMANDLGALFEGQAKLIQHLRQINNEDRLTGLISRSAFEQRIRVAVETRESRRQGVMALLQLARFSDFNKFQGRDEGDALLKAVAAQLQIFVRSHPGSFVGRRAGAEFALFLPGAALADAEFWIREQLAVLDGIYADRSPGREVAVHAGLAVTTEEASVEDLFSACDEALRRAQRSDETGFTVFDTAQAVQFGVEQWRDHLVKALDDERVKLTYQPLQRTLDRGTHHYHVLSRLEVEGDWLPAGTFLPMAERFQLVARLDQLVLTRVLTLLAQHPSRSFGLTFGNSSIADEQFRDWLGSVLASQSAVVLERLWIYIPEDAVHHHRTEVGACVKLLRRLDVRVLVDHFGVGGVPFNYLRNLPFQALRIDPSFIHNIDSHPDNRFYLESIVPIAHSRGVEVFVAGVETAAEWHAITEMRVDGGTGYHLARPDETLD